MDVTFDALATWYDREALRGKDQAARARGMFQACAGAVASLNTAHWPTAKRPKTRASWKTCRPTQAPHGRTGGRPGASAGGRAWRSWENRTASAYLENAAADRRPARGRAAIQWQDVDFQWRKLTLADKATSTRTIP